MRGVLRTANNYSADRVDGRAYHRQLGDDAAPWVGSVLMVADIAKALSAKRPARDSLPWEEMQAIISADAARTRGWGSFGARLRATLRVEPIARRSAL